MTPVGELSELRHIWIYATKFKDYSPLAKLTKLEELHAGISQFDRLDVVATMPNLRSLRLLRDKVTDFSPLAVSANLEEVNIETQNVGDLGIFANKTKLKSLILRDCTVSNAGAIADLPALETLSLRDAKGVDDITVFKDLPKLRRLSVSKGAFPDQDLEVFGDKISQQ